MDIGVFEALRILLAAARLPLLVPVRGPARAAVAPSRQAAGRRALSVARSFTSASWLVTR